MWFVLSTLMRQMRLLALGALTCAALAVTIQWVQPVTYTATAAFISQDAGRSESGLGVLASQFGVSLGRGSTVSPYLYLEILKSKTLLQDVLTTRYSTVREPGTLISFFKIVDGDSAKRLERGVNRIRSVLKPTADRQSGVVRFTVTLTDPRLAAQVGERVLELIDDYNVRRRQSVGRAEREFLERRVGLAADSLRESELALTMFYRSNRAFSESPDLRNKEEQLKRQQLLRTQLFTTLSQNLEAARLEEVRATPQITVLEHPSVLVDTGRARLVQKGLLGAIAGFGVVAILVLLRELLVEAQGSQNYAANRSEVIAALRRVLPWLFAATSREA